MTKIPFTNEQGLPDFKNITIDKIVSTITETITYAKETINSICSVNENPTWNNFSQPLSELDNYCHKVISPITHLTHVDDSKELRKAWDECIPLLAEYSNFVGQNQRLSNRYNLFQSSEEYNSLSIAEKKAVTNSILIFTLSGINLEEDDKKRFTEITNRLSEIKNQFSKNLLDATKGWTKLITDVGNLDGVPETTLVYLKQTATDKDLDGYLITLDHPSYGPILQYATDRALREEVYIASCTKASDQGPNAGKWNNALLMEEIIKLRFEKAALLGYKNHAEVSLIKKMANTTDDVIQFLDDLVSKSKEKAETDNNELKEFVKIHYGYDPLEEWDRSFCIEQLQQSKYSLSDEMVRQYFPADQAVNGLFSVIKYLYKLDIVEAENDNVWHEDVMFFDIYDDGVKIASVYMDLYARSTKQGGAWMGEAIIRYRCKDGTIQLPVAYLNCNFTPPVDGKQSLLTHYDLETLFHEFGHCLHHMLTKVEAYDVSGINGVNWDAVELPSQIMENWCWNKKALNFISCHHETGEIIPDELFNKMIAAKNFMSGTAMLQQMVLSLFDFRLHMEYDRNIRDILLDVRNDILLDPVPEFNRWENSFSHIFSGGYDAGYYSYSWAETLAADAFSEFEKNGIFDQETGQRFRDCILTKGGSKDAMELFVDFMGREPSSDNMLKQKGIIN